MGLKGAVPSRDRGRDMDATAQIHTAHSHVDGHFQNESVYYNYHNREMRAKIHHSWVENGSNSLNMHLYACALPTLTIHNLSKVGTSWLVTLKYTQFYSAFLTY